MKKTFILFLLMLAAAPSWAKIGRHNLLLSFNAGAGIYHDPTLFDKTFSYGFPLGSTKAKALLGFDIGYLLHSVRESGTIHGMDLRVGVLGDIPTSGYAAAFYSYSYFPFNSSTTFFTFTNPVLLTFSIGYTPGRQFKHFRLMFDVIGASFSFAFAKMTNLDTGASRTGVFAGIVYTLPLGMHFIFNKGAYFAVRHQLVVNPYSVSGYEPMVKYAIMFSVGFAFGK